MVDMENRTPKELIVFCMVSVIVKFRVRVSVGFRVRVRFDLGLGSV